MPIITVDNKQIDAPAGITVLRAALDNGIYIPHFCYHPLLSIAGNCRMCLVEVVGRPKLEISCNLPVADGMVINTNSPSVVAARKAVLEFLLINHPIDCPICDQAGECYLQDYHFKYSVQPSRFREDKVRKPKVVDVGPEIKLDDERCVLCTRCVRFCQEITKTSELCIIKRGDRCQITTAPGRQLDNAYSLNTAEICPVGALTSKDFRFKKRVWFLKSTPSVCPNCANGCQMWIDHESGVMYRWRPRKDWLCNEGRLSYSQWQMEGRFYKSLVRSEDAFREAKKEVALDLIGRAISNSNNIVGIVSAQCSCEEVDSFVNFLRGRGAKIYRSKRTPKNPSEDNLLRKRDKNPNSHYIKDIEPVPENLEGEVLVVIDSLADDDLLKVTGFEWKTIIQITHDKSFIVPRSDIILPRATFSETSGTFVNYAGTRQEFKKAFPFKDDARSVTEWVSMLA